MDSAWEQNEYGESNASNEEQKVNASSADSLIDFVAFESKLDRNAEDVKLRDQIVIEDFFVDGFESVDNSEVFLALLHFLDVLFCLARCHVS